MQTKNKISEAVITVVGILLLAYVFFEFFLGALLPIIFGWIISLFIYPLGNWLSGKLKVSRRLVSGFTVILFFLLLIFFAALGIRRLFFELALFAERLESNPEIIEGALSSVESGISKFKLFSWLDNILEALGEYAYVADGILNNMLETTLSSLGDFISGAAKSLVFGIPNAILFLITTVLSAFYCTVDRDKIYSILGSLLPSGIREGVASVTAGGVRAGAGYIKSSLVLMLITFLEMLIFLTLLGVQYSLILSIVIAVVDLLPLLGVGAILVPWSVYSFVVADVRMGVWLLVIFVVATVMRNILEPKILGRRIGVHPFLIVASAYLGYTLLGGAGLLLGPILAAVISSAKKEKALRSHL